MGLGKNMMIFKEKTHIWVGRGRKMGKNWKIFTEPRGNNIIFEKAGGGAKISYLWRIYSPAYCTRLMSNWCRVVRPFQECNTTPQLCLMMHFHGVPDLNTHLQETFLGFLKPVLRILKSRKYQLLFYFFFYKNIFFRNMICFVIYGVNIYVSKHNLIVLKKIVWYSNDFFWFLLKFSMIFADFLLPSFGSVWPKWNWSKRIRIRNTS